MPAADVVYYQELDGSVPVLDWLLELTRRDRRSAAKCLARIEVLRELEHELRRPIADYLRDGIYELRGEWADHSIASCISFTVETRLCSFMV